MALVFVLPSEAALVTVAGGFVGGLVSIASKLTDPPPNPVRTGVGRRQAAGAQVRDRLNRFR